MSGVDFSSGTFNITQHYAAVSMQQGRVQLDADSSEDSEANSEKIRRLTADMAAPLADPTPTGDSTTSINAGALAGFEPAGGLHPVANQPGVALFGGILAHLHENSKGAGMHGLFGDDSGAGDLSKKLQSASAD